MAQMAEGIAGKPVGELYVPELAKIAHGEYETRDVKTLRLEFQNREVMDRFSFSPGQFVELSVPGVGEATFCIASAPSDKGYIQCSIKKVGKVTEALHMLEAGDTVGVRGPYGNSFPLEDMRMKKLLFIGGGIGLAPLRSLIREVFHRRGEFGDITVLYGARSVNDLVFKNELKAWSDAPGVNTVLTVDPGGEKEGWGGRVGFVPAVLKDLSLKRDETVAVTCGPPVMIKYVLLVLRELGFDPGLIYTTLEMKMKCGVGKCGRCNIGPVYVCTDGPVFSLARIEKFIENLF